MVPRRTVLDKLLVDAASEAGAEVREGFTVDDVVIEDGRVTGVRGHGKGGKNVTERARVVIGADGWHSLVARAVRPAQYHEKPRLLCGYYSYWSGLPMNGRFEAFIRPQRSFAAWPTHDDLTLLVGGWPFAEFAANKQDIEGNFLEMLELAPPFADRVRAARREARFVGTAVPNYFRKPFGPGWALVGDAGYNKDFITAQGIQDAFRDAELCATALDADVLRCPHLRRRDGRIPIHSRRARPADVRVHLRLRDPCAPAPRASAAAGGRARQPGSHGRVRAGQRRSDVASRLLF